MMRLISKASVDTWGLEPQMLMVAEECIEVAHAVMKWNRAYKKYTRDGASLTRFSEDDLEGLAEQAHARVLMKATKHLQEEAMQLTFMLDQLQIMQPGDYKKIMDEVLQDATNRLRQRGVKI